MKGCNALSVLGVRYRVRYRVRYSLSTYQFGHIYIQSPVIFTVGVGQIDKVIDVGPHVVFLSHMMLKTLQLKYNNVI